MNDPVHDYLAEVGRKGGASGRGSAKARTSEQARKASLARWGTQPRKARAKRRPNARAVPRSPTVTECKKVLVLCKKVLACLKVQDAAYALSVIDAAMQALNKTKETSKQRAPLKPNARGESLPPQGEPK